VTTPLPYVPAYSFSGWQAINPDRPLPAPSLDTELANIAATAQSLIDALDQVRRADGKLENSSVSLDSLDSDLRTLIENLSPRVTVGDLSPSAFAAQVEAEAGAATDKIMSPLGVAQALGAQRAFASQVQAEGGSNNATVMTPLRVAQALNVLRAYASQAEAQAGTENTKVMTALRVAQALAALRPSVTLTVNTTFGAITAGTGTSQTTAFPGSLPNDRLVMGWPGAGIPTGIVANAWISSTSNLVISFFNPTGVSITPYSGASVTITATALRF
jgi:hypothetical protein